MELNRLLTTIEFPDAEAPARDLTSMIKRVNEAAARQDYFSAIRLLGEVEVTLVPRRGPPSPGTVQPEDVEQALGDLRRALTTWGTETGREAAKVLCREARGAAGEGRWEAAWALIEEADERLAGAGP